MIRRALLACCVALAIGTSSPVNFAKKPEVPAPDRKIDAVQWLDFRRVDYTATLDGEAVDDLTIFAGRNGAKILYALQLERPVKGMICVETTTGFIGYFNASDLEQKDDLLRIRKTAVPPAAKDLSLDVASVEKGYTLTIFRGKSQLICHVPEPMDAYDLLLNTPPEDAEATPQLQNKLEHFTAMEDKIDAALPAPPPAGTGGPSNAGGPAAAVGRAALMNHVETRAGVLNAIRVAQEGEGTPTPIAAEPQGDGVKLFLPPFPDAGTRRECHDTWLASGFAEKHTGLLLAVTEGIGPDDSKTRGEFYAWIGGRWVADKSGKVTVVGTFVEAAATGASVVPQSLATSTGYLYVGVRNERTQDDIWKEGSMGRSPAPFASAEAFKQVIASGLDVQAGDEIVVMVGACDYSSGKYGNAAQGHVQARVQLIKIEVK